MNDRPLQIRFAELAALELNDACDWYEHQQPGLGARFRRDVRESVRRIARNPALFPVELDEVRRYVMTRFPYALRYVVRGGELWVVAVSHQHRRPDYWADRIESA